MDARNPQRGDVFDHAQWLQPDNQTPLRFRVTRVTADTVYYRPVDGGSASYTTREDFPKRVRNV